MNEESASTAAEGSRVTSLELFSDLVFVFAVTQLTTVLVNDPSWIGLGHVLLLFAAIWWMYGGYIWLTNAVRPNRPLRQLSLLAAMAGFLMMGIAIPRVFAGDGTVFGLGYLLVVVIHTGLFTQATWTDNIKGIIRVAPFNLVTALLLIVAGSLKGTAETALWALAVAVQILSPFVSRPAGFAIEAGHFVERYGLLVLIVLGESIAAVGVGVSHLSLTADVVVISVFGLALTAALWWTYFVGDENRAEEVLRDTPAEQRPMRALAAFFYAQIPMFLGVVAIAAAIRTALPHATAPVTQAQALQLGGGAAAYLAGDLWFRTSLGIPRGIWRTLAVPLALCTVAVGLRWSAIEQLAALAAILILALAAESMAERHPEREAEPA
jgi:low temperature requirement protein LtrA